MPLLWHHLFSPFSSTNLTPFRFSRLCLFSLGPSFCYCSARSLSKERSPFSVSTSWKSEFLSLSGTSPKGQGCLQRPSFLALPSFSKTGHLPASSPKAKLSSPNSTLGEPSSARKGAGPQSGPTLQQVHSEHRLICPNSQGEIPFLEANLFSEEQHRNFKILKILQVPESFCGRLFKASSSPTLGIWRVSNYRCIWNKWHAKVYPLKGDRMLWTKTRKTLCWERFLFWFVRKSPLMA